MNGLITNNKDVPYADGIGVDTIYQRRVQQPRQRGRSHAEGWIAEEYVTATCEPAIDQNLL